MPKVLRKTVAKKVIKSAVHTPHPTPTRARVTRADKAVAAPPMSVAQTVARRVTRKATLLALLQRPEGAVLEELVIATGWQGHSVRAALTHFRLAGHAVTRERDAQGASRYHLAAA